MSVRRPRGDRMAEGIESLQKHLDPNTRADLRTLAEREGVMRGGSLSSLKVTWWEGNTLVIDVTNVKAKSRLDMVGNFYSPSARFVERLTVVDDKTINYEATITDPTVYTRPWTLTARFVRRFPNDGSYEVFEDACHEGERTADTLVIPPGIAQKSASAGTASSKQ